MTLFTSTTNGGNLVSDRRRFQGLFRWLRAVLGCFLVGSLGAVCLAGCSWEPKKPESQWNQPVNAAPAPKGWVNSKDGAFRIKIPGSYLDAYDAASGEKLPDAQVILSLPSSQTLHGYIPVLVIDHAKATTDPDIVKKTLKKDKIYKTFKDFTVLNPTQVEGLNVLSMTWKYTYQEVEMTAFMTMVFGNNHAYALKQDVPDYALDTYKPIVEAVLKSWTWNEPQ